MPEGTTSRWEIELPDEGATEALARRVAPLVHAGDLVTLSGDLGAGKTTLARALIRVLTRDPELEVPSPTFTLMQLYDTDAFPIVHADLYRIKSPGELAGLGWDEAAEGALVLVEWAERASDELPSDRLDIALRLDPGRSEQYRAAVLTGRGTFAPRLARAKALDDMLGRSGWLEAARSHMQGDASTRAYERLQHPDGRRAILMISPRRADGPPVRFGKPYSAIARLAEDIGPFLAMAQGLRERGYSAPEIYASEPEAGLALLEDLGTEGVVDAGGPIPERLSAATAVLASLHQTALPDWIDAQPEPYRIPPYDIEALAIEVELLVDWYAPHIARAPLSSGARATFVNLWRETLAEIIAAPATWTLRDYHSPNLLWLPEREGLQKVGLLDFQDCVMGHPAYDVASLLQDARVTVPDQLEIRLLGEYSRLRRHADPAFDIAAFARAYAIMGAQRATKILGIFARLDKRDRKPQYLAHLPRVQHYLAKDLAHPALATMRGWYEAHLPQLLGPQGHV
ncbi:MAG: tRNA ((37)-N6)-threonylcarbamoyltransferase complex ATPase subunit type 1 TsaE [Hyphomicrobiales bacterium]|nr:tRNA ((37)-N6)-threonylcarbamoyltransferase complex ATPase subunit type 1 TsaE [Hyphomicrobiales bacterium]